jgi:hypothetical protein
MDLTELVYEVVNWVHVVQGRYHWQNLVETVIKLRVPQKARITLSEHSLRRTHSAPWK